MSAEDSEYSLTEEQFAAIGRFATSFGFLESMVEQVVSTLSGMDPGTARIVLPSPALRQYSARASKLLKRRLPVEHHAAVAAVMRTVHDLADYRNALLHSPMVRMRADSELFVTDAIDHPSLGVITPESVKQRAREADRAFHELSDLWKIAFRAMRSVANGP